MRFWMAVPLYLMLVGCGNFSPRQQQRINNQGKIGEIESLANSLKAEIGNLQNQNDIQNSRLEKIQQGMVNLQSNYDNSGIQIFSGPGGLLAGVVIIFILSFLVIHYHQIAKIQTKTAEILAQNIVFQKDPHLENNVFQSAMYTEAEENILNLIKKHKDRIIHHSPES